MVSNFIEEKYGYLALTQEEHDRVKMSDPSCKVYARQLLEYGEAKEGYWSLLIKLNMQLIKIAIPRVNPQDGDEFCVITLI